MKIKSTAEQIIITGNNIDSLKKYPDNFFDSIVTDPPYGLGKEPNSEEMLRAWITDGYMEVKGTGFMGKEWDAFVPQPIFWKEVFRVLKHGGHVVSFFGTRTYDWGVMSMRLAGFEVRDCIQWLYSTGFPKSHNISKAIDKMYGAEREVVGQGKAGKGFNKVKGFGTNTTKSDEFTSEWDVTESSTDQAKEWDGWGSALKPANEPIVLARKPLEKGLSIAENVLKWGTGAINIDASRIATSETITNHSRGKESSISKGKYGDSKPQETHQTIGQESGRFPSNVILTHHPECECLGLKKVKAISGGTGEKSKGRLGVNGKYGKYALEEHGANAGGLGDENGQEIIENWECHDDCPIKILDEQSGVLKSGKMTSEHKRSTDGSPHGIYGKFDVNHPLTETYGDIGGASRFFYVAKASKSERNFGLDGKKFNGIEIILKTCGKLEEKQIWSEKITIQEEKLVKRLEDMDISLKKVIEEFGVPLKKDIEWNTSLYMNSIMERYQRDSKFITLTETNLTIIFQISNWLRHYNTKENTVDANLLTELSISLAKNAEQKIQFQIIINEQTEFVLGAKNAVLKMQFIINEKERTNFHSTVKPVKLMQYLVRMITPPNGTVLDPFAGSGTTGVACKIDGFNFVGLELSEEYSEIARARIAKFVEEKEFIDDCKIFESEKNKIDTQYRLFD